MSRQEQSVEHKTPLLFTVTTPPFMHTGQHISELMLDTVLALLPALVLSAVIFGIGSLRVTALSIAAAVFADALCMRLAGRYTRSNDGSALVIGMLFAYLLPPGAPWWLVIIGSSCSIILGRQIFGGLGTNFLCVPLVGWAILTISWPTQMDPSAVTLNTDLIDPLLRLKNFGPLSLAEENLTSYLLGQQLGGLGSTQILALTFGGLYLLLRKVIRWELVLAFLLGIAITGTIFWRIDPSLYCQPILYFATGSSVFAAFFLATDPASTPMRPVGMLIFGLSAGALVVLIRIFGVYPDGAPFAVLVANLFTPLLDLIRPKPFGFSKQKGGSSRA